MEEIAVSAAAVFFSSTTTKTYFSLCKRSYFRKWIADVPSPPTTPNAFAGVSDICKYFKICQSASRCTVTQQNGNRNPYFQRLTLPQRDSLPAGGHRILWQRLLKGTSTVLHIQWRTRTVHIQVHVAGNLAWVKGRPWAPGHGGPRVPTGLSVWSFAGGWGEAKSFAVALVLAQVA